MARISLDIEDEVHNRLKALAALKGVSLKEFLLSRVLGETEDETRSLAELRAFLEKRIESAAASDMSRRTVKEIFDQAYREAESGSHA